MSEHSPERVKAVFSEAAELPTEERTSFLDAACGADTPLRRRVDRLLRSLEEVGPFLASPTGHVGPSSPTRSASTHPPVAAIGSSIGPYKLLQEIGEGGFGVVYMAEQERPVRRRVALKVIKLGMDTKQVIARFEAERQALAMMEHPNIATVLDAGATEAGRPYFVMELVRGVAITEYCDKENLTTRERLRLFTNVCSAVQHAHQKGVIHRDIKPSNVMVTLHDGNPVPKVIDFGIAKATHQRLTEKTMFTEYGQFIGSPAYMSPEQAEMSGLDVDTRSDIYSLGVLLYELLTGTTPFDPKTLRDAAYDEIQRMIREEEPPTPSTRLGTLGDALADIAKHRQADPRALTTLIRGDLDWIVMKALEKNRTRRYDSASALAADIARHFDSEPVLARPPSAVYRLRKFVRKHKGPVAAAAAIGATIVVLGSVAFWQGRTAQRRARQVQQQALQIQQQSTRVRAHSILSSAVAAEDPLLKALLLNELADLPEVPGRLNLARDVANHPLPTAILRGHEERLTDGVFSPDSTRVATASDDGTVRVWRTDGTGEPIVLRGHEEQVYTVAFSPDGTRLVTASPDETARIWRLDGRAEPIVLRGHPNTVNSAVFSPDGTRVVTASWDRTARVWQADGRGEPIVLRGHERMVSSAAFSPDGERVVTASTDRTVRIWRADGTGHPIVLREHANDVVRHEAWLLVWAVFSPDGTRVLSFSTDGTARVWRADGTGEPVVMRHAGRGWGPFGFSPDGTRVVTASGETDTVKVWRADGSGKPIVLRGRGGVFSPDGEHLLTLSDNAVRVWRADGSGEPIVLRGGGGGADFSPNGEQVLTFAEEDTAARLWRIDWQAEAIVHRGHEGAVRSAIFSPDGERVVTASEDGTARVWPADGQGAPFVLRGHEGGVQSATFSPDGERVVTTSEDGTVRIWRADGTAQPIVLRGHEGVVDSAVFSPRGAHVATASEDGTVRVWRADGSGEPVILRLSTQTARRPREVYFWWWAYGRSRVAFSPDGTRLVTASEDFKVQVWPANGIGEPVLLHRHPGTVYVAAFSPDGTRVVTVSDGGARISRADGTGEPVILRGHCCLFSGAFSPDSTRVLIAGEDGDVRLSPADGSRKPLLLFGHDGDVNGAAFSPDGTRIVTASEDGTARVWRADGTGEPLVLRGHEGDLSSAVFSPDGTRVVTASADGTARVWRVTWPGLLEHVRANLHACLTPEQRVQFLVESPTEAAAAYAECERGFGRKADTDVFVE